MTFNWADSLCEIQVDITTHCNASCPSCARNFRGGDKYPGLPLDHFPLDIWKRFAAWDTKTLTISKLTLNGNWGDAMMHPNLVEMIQVWTECHPESFINIATNGSLRSHKFWYDLGSILSKTTHRLEFAVDGLADTHSIYRRGTDFEKLSNNIKSFIDGGGYAQPVITVFHHNEHQIDDIVKYCQDLGCQAVEIRPSMNKNMHVETSTESFYITAPNNIERKEIVWQEYPVTESYEKSWPVTESKRKNTKCPWYNRAEIQIDPWARVWPCCHISNIGKRVKDRDFDVKEFDTVGAVATEFNNLEDNSLLEILDNKWYTNTVPDTIYGDNPWMVCKKSCDVHM
jgi:MoaA/NifB/PqqE/SkfB family radical SAM enzyme